MTWFKVDDHLHSHRKAMRAGTEAMGLWVLAGSWSAAEESDGWVPDYVLGRLVGAQGVALADQLVTAGLWETGTVDGEDGYRFREWEDYQPTRAQLEAKREQARERMQRVRANGAGSAQSVTPTPTRPDPSKDTNASKAADPAAFESWWEGYPRKTGKAAAAKAYDKARKTATADQLMAGLANACAVWRAERTEARFIPHPATWLNQGRWDDEQPELPGATDAARPATLRQCDGTACPGSRHGWTDARNAYLCQGA